VGQPIPRFGGDFFSRSAAFARCVPFGAFIAFLVLSSLFQAQWLVLARGLVVATLLAWYWRRYSELRTATRVSAGYWLLAAATGFAVFIAWITLDGSTALVRTAPFAPLDANAEIDWPVALLRLAGFSLVVPLMEELFWRSFLLRWLERSDFLAVDPGKVGVRSFIITTVLFGVEHNHWVAGAIAGAAYNWLYMRSGNLWLPIGAHALTNAVLGVWIIATGNWHLW
jgi:CAAX prenyl protease-like protein